MNEQLPNDDALRSELDALCAARSGRAGDDDAAARMDLDGLFEAVAAETVDRRPGVRDRLRELPTPMRIALAVAGALLMTVAALVLTRIRADLSGQALLRYGLAMTAIAGLVGVVFAISMRGAYQRPIGRGVWALIFVGLVVPLVLSVMPWLWETGTPSAAHATGTGYGPCVLLGLLTGALTAGVAWIFQRDDVPVLWRSLAAVAGGGLTAFAMLQLHCPAREATHLLVTHAGVGLMLAAVVAVLVTLRRRAI